MFYFLPSATFFCPDHYFCALREAVKEQCQPLVTQDAEGVKTTSWQRKQQQTARLCVCCTTAECW